jgi:hypothetical protein
LSDEEVVVIQVRSPWVILIVSTLVWLSSAQTPNPSSKTVEVRFQLSWWADLGTAYPRAVNVRLDPLDGSGQSQILRLSESSTIIARVVPGRYQLTSITPLSYQHSAYGWTIELPLIAAVNYVALSQENAVRIAPGTELEPVVAGASARTATADETKSDAEIAALLNRWVGSIKSRSLNAQMSCYAPQLANYLQAGSVSRGQVELQKKKMFNVYTSIRRLELADIDITLHGTRAVANAVKSWDFSNGEADWHGRTLVSFGLERIDSHWVITSEQEYAASTPTVQAQPRLAVSRASADQ